MQSTQSKIIRNNIVSLVSGQSISFILNFFSILLAARYLGVEDFGRFATYLSTILILSKLIDFGLGPIILREISKDMENLDWLNKALTLRIIISIFVLLLLNSFYFFIDYDLKEVILVNSLFITVFISSRTQNFREIFAIPFKASLRMQVPMFLNSLDNFLLLIGVLSIPYVSRSLDYFIIVYVGSNLPGFIMIILSLIKQFKFRYHVAMKNNLWLVKEALPLAGFVLMSIIFQQVDILLLDIWRPSFDTGVFAAATRLTLPLNIIPSTIVIVVFPLIVRNIKDNSSNDFIVQVVLKILLVVSLALAFCISINPKEFIVLIFGNSYIEAYLPTILLMWSQVFLFINFFTLDLFTAYNIQKWNFIYSVIIVVLNIVLDIILIPAYSYKGVGFAKIISSFVGFIFILFISRSISLYTNVDLKRLIPFILIFPLSLYLVSRFPTVIYFILAALFFVIIVFILKIFDVKESQLLISMIGSPKWLKRIFKSQ